MKIESKRLIFIEWSDKNEISWRKCKFVNGKYYDSISMDILAEEFEGDFIRNKNI